MVNQYDPYINSAAQRFSLDPNLIRSVIQAESNGKPGAISNKGAGGLMQIMPATYEELRQKHGFGEDRFDPENNINAGAAYLRQMQDRFGAGNPDTVLAAYNAGPGRVARGGPLPAETQQYVTKVKGNMMGLLGQQGTGSGPRGGLLADEEQILANMQQNQMPPQPGGFSPAQQQTVNGVIGGFGQQPPAAMPPAAQQSPVNARVQELIGQTVNAPQARPVDPRQYAMQGAMESIAPLAGITNRRVGLGEVLGAAGAGIGRGEQAAQAAQRQQRADQFGELSNTMQVAKYQQNEASTQRQIAAANAYADQIEKINPSLAAALRNNPSLMDEVAKAQAGQTFQKAADPTAQERNALAMGLVRGTPAFNDYIQKSSMPAGSVNIQNTQEKSEDQAFGQELVKEYAGIRGRGEAAQTTLQQLQIAKTIPVQSGALEPLKAQASAFAQALGFSGEKLAALGLDTASDAQAYEGIMKRVVLSVMQSQAGPQTDSDAKRIEQTVASLSNTPAARDFLMKAAENVALRDIEQRNFYDSYRMQNKSLDGAGKAWREQQETRPLVSRNPNSGRTVFMYDYVKDYMTDNPGSTQDDALKMWSTKYGRQ